MIRKIIHKLFIFKNKVDYTTTLTEGSMKTNSKRLIVNNIKPITNPPSIR